MKAILELTVRRDRLDIGMRPVSGADLVFDCIGLEQTMEQIVPAVRTGFFGAQPGGTAPGRTKRGPTERGPTERGATERGPYQPRRRAIA